MMGESARCLLLTMAVLVFEGSVGSEQVDILVMLLVVVSQGNNK